MFYRSTFMKQKQLPVIYNQNFSIFSCEVISVYNCFHENVNFNIGRKVLQQHGFQITPEKVSKVLPGKKVKLELTCFRDRTATKKNRMESMAGLLSSATMVSLVMFRVMFGDVAI